MRTYLTAAFMVALLAMPATVQAHHLHPQKRSARGDVAKRLRPGCTRHYRMRRFYRYTKARYARREEPLTHGQKVWVKHLALCLATKKKSHWAYVKKHRWRKRFRARLAYHRLTPYVCANGTRWAIPCYIVACESHYSWWARNPSGAVGPYQLLGWGAIYPARTWAQRMQNHRIAARVYAGGRGRSNWVC